MNRFFFRLFRAACVAFAVGAITLTTDAADARAATIFESGTLGPTGLTFDDFGNGPAPSGSFISDFAFTGVRFELTQPIVTTRIGGHVVVDPGHEDTFFGAIVQLDDATDFPDSGNLSSPDVLGNTLLTFPETSTEVFGDIALSLVPGWYALVFGSGIFEATGQGAAIANNSDIGSPSYIAHQNGTGWFEISPPNGPFENFRLIVEGTIVPEPQSAVTAILSALALIGLRKRTREYTLQ